MAELGDFAVQIDLFVWIEPPRRVDTLDVIDAVLERGKAALVAAGIDLPFPTRQILLHDQTEETDGDRGRQREGWPARPDREHPKRRRIIVVQRDDPPPANGAARQAPAEEETR